MGSVNKNQTDGEVLYYDVAAGATRKGNARSLASKYSTKDTVNLCIRERKGISYELFFLIFAAILLVLLLIEFFGVYRPYLDMEAREAELTRIEASTQDLYDQMSDRTQVRDLYRQHNYENFPRERVDREDVFDLIERLVFDKAIITSFTLRENVLTLGLHGPVRSDLEKIANSIMDDELVLSCGRSNWTQSESGFDTTLTITFKDAE